jgi:predicted RNase H-like HicB family nuclease
MSDKSKKPAKAIDRPFSAQFLKEARRIAAEYQVVLHCEAGHWYGRSLEMPHVFGDGKTADKCIKDTQEALCGAVACLLEQGRKPPTPAREGTRTQQVNVRLTADEKAVLESTAKRKGFKGLSEFLRAAALDATQ